MVALKSRLVLLACLLLAPLAAQAFDLTPVVGPAGPDVSAEFQRDFGARLTVSRAELSPYKVLLIPGFSADYLDDTVGYFADARRELRRLGLREGTDFELVMHQHDFSGERTTAENAAALAALLRESPRPVLAITHSKGAVDLMETLLVYKDTRAKLRGWFSWQGANGGSILADVVTSGWTRPFMDGFLHAYGGSIEALEDLRQPVRAAYLRQNLDGIREVLGGIPVVSLVTQKDYDRLSFRLKTVAKLFDPDYRASASDGMVGIHDSMMPYSPYVFLTGVSHEETCETGSYDRVGLAHASLRMLLDRVRAR